MVGIEDYGEFETAWCPGCGNFSILKSLKAALAGLELEPHQVCLVSGIGQAAKTPHYLKSNVFNGLHGRSLPAAQGIKLANPELVVVDVSGDGCQYGEGGNHFLAAARRNMDITMLTHDNQIYGLTKGQASPTTMQGQKTKAQPFGVPSQPFNPVAVAVTMKVSFVARAFAGDPEHLTGIIQEAIRHKGFALVDILQPCVSFNKVNTYSWYKERCCRLESGHDPTDWSQALNKACEFGDRIPLGVIYRNDSLPTFESRLPTASGKPLALGGRDKNTVYQVMKSYA